MTPGDMFSSWTYGLTLLVLAVWGLTVLLCLPYVIWYWHKGAPVRRARRAESNARFTAMRRDRAARQANPEKETDQ